MLPLWVAFPKNSYVPIFPSTFVSGAALAIYVAATGSDSTGTGQFLKPFQTFAKALTISSASSTILGFGGDTFRETITTTAVSQSFGSWGFGRAIINGSNLLTGWGLSPGTGTNTYSASLVTQALIVHVNNARAVLGGSNSTLNDGEWFWVSSKMYYRSNAGNPDTVPLSIDVGQRTRAITTSANASLHIDNLQIQRTQDSSNGAINLTGVGSPNDLRVTNCLIQDNYTSGIYFNQDSTSGLFDNNIIQNNGQHGLWFAASEDGSTTAGSINQTITNNQVLNNGWRFDASVNFPSGIIGGIRAGVIAFNTCYNNGISGSGDHAHGIYCGQDLAPGLSLLIHDNLLYGQTQGLGIKCTQDATIYNNIIHDNLGGGINIGQNAGGNNAVFTLYRNLVYNNATTAAAGIDAKNSGTGTMSIKGYNNTTYNNSAAGGGSGAEVLIETNCLVLDWRNNIHYANGSNGSAKYLNFFTTQTGTVTIDNNSYFNSSNANPFSYNSSGISYTTWKAESFSPDAHSITTNPLFTNIGSDFTLQGASPCIDAGVVISGITDGYLGAAPDIGYAEKA